MNRKVATPGRWYRDFAEAMVDTVEEAAGMLPYFKLSILKDGKLRRMPDADLLEVAKDYYRVMAPVFRKAIRKIERGRQLGMLDDPWVRRATEKTEREARRSIASRKE